MYSVLMSVYQREKPEYLKESIQSVLEQTLVTDDFVIVCDGPLTNELEDVLSYFLQKTYCIQLVRSKTNQGLGKALNLGLMACRHECVARMDSDDISKKDRMEKEYMHLMHKNLDLISCALTEFETDIKHLKKDRKVPVSYDEILQFSKRRNPFNHPCVMFKKKAVLEAGGYVDFPYFEDYCLWLRMLHNGAKAENLKDSLLYMRCNPDMYKRRGGRQYAKCIWRFRTYMLKNGFCSLIDFLKVAPAHCIVSLLPNGFREKLYTGVLRKE